MLTAYPSHGVTPESHTGSVLLSPGVHLKAEINRTYLPPHNSPLRRRSFQFQRLRKRK